jgi:flagellar basal body-associated protein FliL
MTNLFLILIVAFVFIVFVIACLAMMWFMKEKPKAKKDIKKDVL